MGRVLIDRRRRYRFHDGLSTGARTDEGRARNIPSEVRCRFAMRQLGLTQEKIEWNLRVWSIARIVERNFILQTSAA